MPSFFCGAGAGGSSSVRGWFSSKLKILESKRTLYETATQARWLLGFGVAALTAASYAQWSNPAEDVPAYHPCGSAEGERAAADLAGDKLTGENFRYPWQVHVYQQAAKVGNVIYQLPCNCRCDRALGHTSLRSCFETLHGTECSTCAKEGFYAYQQTKLGKSPAEIRAGDRAPRLRVASISKSSRR